MRHVLKSVVAILLASLAADAAYAGCGRNQVYSSSLGQCMPRVAGCGRNQVYSSSLGQCMPRVAGCSRNQVYSSSLGQCMPRG
jgi:hypothetical protein